MTLTEVHERAKIERQVLLSMMEQDAPRELLDKQISIVEGLQLRIRQYRKEKEPQFAKVSEERTA